MSPKPEGVSLTEAGLPTPKPGQWRIVTTLDGRAQPPQTFCEKGGHVLQADETHGSKCDPAEVVRRPDGAFWSRRVCRDGKSTTVAIAVVRGGTARHYTIDGDMTVNGDGLPLHIVAHDELDYIGPCSADAGKP
jgi:hypothetical protein